jgi:acetyl esterase/lipase
VELYGLSIDPIIMHKLETEKQPSIFLRCAWILWMATFGCMGFVNAEDVGSFENRSVVSIWPEGTAKVDSSIAEEVTRREVLRLSNIHNPSLTIFRPEKPNGTAVVICPGGGYRIIAIEHEGYDVAERLNKVGITAYVLKYRLPTTKDAGFMHPIPMSDALRAVQWVRLHADDFGVDQHKIGLMGFSAGGHLTATAGTLFERYSIGSDAVAEMNARPDFMCLVYPVITTQQGVAHGCAWAPIDPDKRDAQLHEMSCELNVTEQTPPTFFAHAKDDKVVKYQNSVLMHEALQAQGVSSELRLYEEGGHGFGLGHAGKDSQQWSDDFIAWMRQLHFLPSN